MVALNYVRHRLAPLQVRGQPVWRFIGPSDPRHLHHSRLDHDTITAILREFFELEGTIALPESVHPLYDDNDHESILASLSTCDRWGIIPEGLPDPECPNLSPWLEEVSDSESEDGRGDGDPATLHHAGGSFPLGAVGICRNLPQRKTAKPRGIGQACSQGSQEAAPSNSHRWS